MLSMSPNTLQVWLTQSVRALVVSAVLMLGSPAFAHDLSGSTCAADVVFLWDQKHFADCGLHGGMVNHTKEGQYCGGAASMVHKPDDPAADEHGRVAVGARRPILYGHTKAVIDALSATGADVRFSTAEQSIDPATMLAVGNYGCLLYTSPSPRDLSTSRMPSSA